MNLYELKRYLKEDFSISVLLPDGNYIPKHFHLTEIGHANKTFIDCGGTYRQTTSCVLQFWVANDTEHRLTTTKMLKIFELAEMLVRDNFPVEIEYGEKVVSIYALDGVCIENNELILILKGKQTTCLAPDKCGVSCLK